MGRTHLAITVELVHGSHTAPLVGRRGARRFTRRSQDQARQAAAERTVRVRLRLGRQLAAPVHRWAEARGPREGAWHGPRQTAAVLGLGRYPRPVRPPLERGRRQLSDAARTGRAGGSPSDPAVVGPQPARVHHTSPALGEVTEIRYRNLTT
jgi:hypothetical protein